MEALSLNGTAAARASCDRHVHSLCPCALHAAALVFVATHSPATQRGRLVERACEGGHLQKTDRRVPPDAPPEGNANVAACPLLSAEATGESKDSSTE